MGMPGREGVGGWRGQDETTAARNRRSWTGSFEQLAVLWPSIVSDSEGSLPEGACGGHWRRALKLLLTRASCCVVIPCRPVDAPIRSVGGGRADFRGEGIGPTVRAQHSRPRHTGGAIRYVDLRAFRCWTHAAAFGTGAALTVHVHRGKVAGVLPPPPQLASTLCLERVKEVRLP